MTKDSRNKTVVYDTSIFLCDVAIELVVLMFAKPSQLKHKAKRRQS
jgi:hypothetical protein